MTKVKKKITYVLTVSRFFPATHPRAGQPTNFPELMLSGDKAHTVRGNYDLWKKRADKINAGLAVLSLRYWTGKPYASKQHEFTELSSIGLQKVHVYQLASVLHSVPGAFACVKNKHTQIFIDNKIIPLQHPFKFAAKDGLSLADFNAWFKKPGENMAVIHFNSHFKY